MDSLSDLGKGVPFMELKVDEKWSISYDPDNNDRPLKLFRYGEYAGVDMHNQKNYVLAMFYRILELEEQRCRSRKA